MLFYTMTDELQTILLSFMDALRVAKCPTFLEVENKDCDQLVQICRLILIFAVFNYMLDDGLIISLFTLVK